MSQFFMLEARKAQLTGGEFRIGTEIEKYDTEEEAMEEAREMSLNKNVLSLSVFRCAVRSDGRRDFSRLMFSTFGYV